MTLLLKDMLRTITSGLQIPTIIILLLLVAASVFMTGSLIAEYFTDRRRLKAKIPELMDEMARIEIDGLEDLITRSGLLKRQKKAILQVVQRGHLSENNREALARQLLFDEQNHYEKVTKITDVISRIAPMFGLMGTLIPLGPGLIALGQGDTKTLSESLLIAFDTTVAGLISGAIAFIISSIRKRWYEGYVVGLETILECVLEKQSQSKGGGSNETK